MLAFLSQLEAQKRQPTARERYLLTTMIENSNNASASALYAAIGNQAGITAFMRQVGLSGLARPARPGAGAGARSRRGRWRRCSNGSTPARS